LTGNLAGQVARASMGAQRGRELYEWIRDHQPQDCLELGFAHGVSTVYIAAALESLGSGRLTSVDRELALELEPLAADLLTEAGLTHRVDLVYEKTSYNWFLHRKLREQLRDGSHEPCYDFVFIDGAHTWEDDGLAFLLVDKLLRPGGWVLFDDLQWRRDDRWPDVPPEQRALAQVGEVFELLVSTHPSYRELRSDGNWGWARKAEAGEPPIRTVRRRETGGAGRRAISGLRRRLSRD
jgi:predicted O-methyltransferase YrrM